VYIVYKNTRTVDTADKLPCFDTKLASGYYVECKGSTVVDIGKPTIRAIVV